MVPVCCCQNLLGDMPTVRHVIYMDDGKKVDSDNVPNNVHLHSMSSVQELGAQPNNRAYPELAQQFVVLFLLSLSSGVTVAMVTVVRGDGGHGYCCQG